MARCIIAYIRDSWNGSSRGAMHAFVAATPACAFQAVMASPPAGATNAAWDRVATGPGNWVNTPAAKAITRNNRSCLCITPPHPFLGSSVHADRLPVVACCQTVPCRTRDRTNATVETLDRRFAHSCKEFLTCQAC